MTQVSGHIAQLSDICVKGNTIVGATEVDAKLLQKCFSTLGLYNEESKYSLTGEGAFFFNMCTQMVIVYYLVLHLPNVYLSDLLQCFLVEREKMKEELRCCTEKIQVRLTFQNSDESRIHL